LNPFIGTAVVDAWRMALLAKMCLFEEFDVIHVFVCTIPSSAALFMMSKFLRWVRRTRPKLLIDWDDWWGRGGIWREYNPLLRVFGTVLEESPPVIADGVTVVSGPLRKRALDLGISESKIFEIPNGANIDGIQLLSKSTARRFVNFPIDERIITHVGLTNINAFGVLLDMFSMVHDAVPTSKLILVGELRSQHRKLVQRSRVRNSISCLGPIPYSKIGLILSASDILCLSMRETIEEHARFPIRIGDFLAAGRPIVATDTMNVSKIIMRTNSGLLARANDPKDFASKVLELLTNKELSESLGMNGRYAAENDYSWESISEKLRKAYQHL
jgi:glycosyltransferase involved in cell wall biosynthesis